MLFMYQYLEISDSHKAHCVPTSTFFFHQYNKDARFMADFDPIIGKRSGYFPNVSSKRSSAGSPFLLVSKLSG